MRTQEQKCLGKEGQMRLRYTRSPKIRSGNDPTTERTRLEVIQTMRIQKKVVCMNVNRSDILDRGHLQEDSKITFNSVLFLLRMFLYPQRRA